MSEKSQSIYTVHPAVSELYDAMFTRQEDAEFILRLIGERKGWRILEPFCGTGRILLRLAAGGHKLFGIDLAENFLYRLKCKSYLLPSQYRKNLETRLADAIKTYWSNEMDLVILASNCFYELSTAETQEKCIFKAYSALKPGGFIYIDNDHMEGDLDESWQNYSVAESFPSGMTKDGFFLNSTRQAVWFDVQKRLVKFERKTLIKSPDGKTDEITFIQQKHPVSKLEVEKWLVRNGFSILKVFGDYQGNVYNKHSPRAIFWAQKI